MLHDFKNKPFITALKSFFESLNVPFNSISEYQTSPEEVIGEKKCNDIIDAIYPFGIVTDAIFDNEAVAITQSDLKKDKYEGILLFGVEISKEKPTRSDLAEITRQINREFAQTPVVVVFKYGNQLTFANAERLDFKQTWREGEKVGKVSMLKDISLEKTHAAHERILLDLKNKNSDGFEDLYLYWQKVLHTKELNKQFFKKIANWYFLSVAYSKFPYKYLKNDIKLKDKTNDELQAIANQKATIRFITRMIFVWFLKEKGLINSDLFDQKEVSKILKKDNKKEPSNYYNAILQNLFFATLNKATEHREFAFDKGFHKNKSTYDVNSLYRYENMFQDENPENIMQLFEKIPFLNGGLFDSLDVKPTKDYPEIKTEIIDGFSRKSDWQALMPDFLFFKEDDLDFDEELREIYGTKKEKYNVKGLFAIFNEYKFTIEENTPTETDVALDPYLLGEIFENLLAYYNPETGTTARKGSGSFYTPQEIVNYMVDESLNAYLETKLEPELTNLPSFKNLEGLNTQQKTAIVQALSDVKILDPACGSGAFPMGVLYKMVAILKHIDTDNSIWKQIQHDKIIGEKIAELEADKKAIQGLSDKQVKEKATVAVEDRLNELETIFNNEYNFDDYARKLYIIQNCIYGVDIQDVAIQISKLRFFLSLIVDQKNEDIKPLPNLETKFVIANTLIGIDLPKFTVMGEDDHSQDTTKALKEELKNVREQHFKAVTRKEKQHIKEQDKAIREKIANSLAEEANSKNEFEIEEQKKQIEKLKLELLKAADLPETEEIETGTLFDTKKELIYPRKNKISELNRSIKNCESKIVGLQTNTQAEQIRIQAMKIAQWDIYNQNAQADWFDAEWMFGLSPEDSNVEVNQLNKQITATNNQIDALNNAIQHKIYKIVQLQFTVTHNQLDVLVAQIKIIEERINTIFGTIKSDVNDVVNEPQSLEFEINALNNRIADTNLLLSKLKTDIKTAPSQGVFDIVIGNPPYVTFKGKEKVQITDDELNKLIKTHPNSAEYKINSYALFLEDAFNFLKINGNVNFIIPSTILQNEYLKNIRKHLIVDNQLLQIIAFENKVFEAVTDSIILISLKGKNQNTNCDFIRKKNVDFSNNEIKKYDTTLWNNNSDFVINFKTNESDDFILNKMLSNCEFVEDYLNVYVGVVASGIKKFLLKEAKNKNHKKYLQGKHINNYLLKPEKLFINFIIEQLHSNTDEKVYNQKEKILVRKTGNVLLAYLDKEQFYTDQSIYNLYPKKGKQPNLTFFTGLFNSKLLDFYFNKKMITNADIFPYIKGIHLKKLPIKIPSNQQPFITIVNQILDLKKLGQDTSDLEHQIDIMVYHLYELTYDEALVIDKTLTKEDFAKFR
jgi:hypothetical protein